MRPLPTTIQTAPLAVKPVPAVNTQTLELGPLSNSPTPASNRRATSCPVQRAYPWLLVGSTAVAAIFCGLYLTKPVIIAANSPGPAATATAPAPAFAAVPTAASKPPTALLPGTNSLPGDASKPQAADPRRLASNASGPESALEETNLRIQHVLKAQGPAGEDLGKVMLEVPVLYRSRALRWTPDEIIRARELMTRIGNYQEATRMLHGEGNKLLQEWNTLVGHSIPATVLRADSPSLSRDQAQPATEEGLDSTEAIEIHNR